MPFQGSKNEQKKCSFSENVRFWIQILNVSGVLNAVSGVQKMSKKVFILGKYSNSDSNFECFGSHKCRFRGPKLDQVLWATSPCGCNLV